MFWAMWASTVADHTQTKLHNSLKALQNAHNPFTITHGIPKDHCTKVLLKTVTLLWFWHLDCLQMSCRTSVLRWDFQKRWQKHSIIYGIQGTNTNFQAPRHARVSAPVRNKQNILCVCACARVRECTDEIRLLSFSAHLTFWQHTPRRNYMAPQQNLWAPWQSVVEDCNK